MLTLTDTHCHLNLNTFQDDLNDVMARAADAGVCRILVPGIDIPTSQTAVSIAEKFPNVFASVGIHPTDANTWDDQSLAELEILARHPKVVAIGEIGLDYYWDRAPRSLQKEVFQSQLDLAARCNLPVVIHNRDAWNDIWFILQEWSSVLAKSNAHLFQKPGVLHAFDGTLEEGLMAANMNFLVGIGGPITYKNAAEKRRLGANLPENCILIETDAPYLTPHPHRGKRNEPAFTAYISKKLAELRASDENTIAGITARNANRLFCWES